MNILAWFIVAFFAWIFVNAAMWGLLDWQSRRAMRRKRAADLQKRAHANGQ